MGSQTKYASWLCQLLLYFKDFRFFNFYLFIYFWLDWVFIAAQAFSLIAMSRGYSWVAVQRLLLRQSTGLRVQGLRSCGVRTSCFPASGIFPDQGSNSCPLHWQADSLPLSHQGSPLNFITFRLSYNKQKTLLCL